MAVVCCALATACGSGVGQDIVERIPAHRIPIGAAPAALQSRLTATGSANDSARSARHLKDVRSLPVAALKLLATRRVDDADQRSVKGASQPWAHRRVEWASRTSREDHP
jgi:hypothetical protein